MPHYFIMENLTSLQDTETKSKNNSSYIAALFRKLNYMVRIVILKAEEFGLPQRRERLYFLGEKVNKHGTCCLDNLTRYVTKLATTGSISIPSFLNHDHKFKDVSNKRKYTSSAVDKKWTSENKKIYKEYGMAKKFVIAYTSITKIPAALRGLIRNSEGFWSLQNRSKNIAVFLMLYLRRPCVQAQEGIVEGSIVVCDLNCSILWSLGALGINVVPCITTKSIMAELWPEFRLLSDRDLFNLQGLDADSLEDFNSVAHRDRMTIAGEAFVAPMAGFLVGGLLSVANFLPVSLMESERM
jgi:hypothetical protein